MLALDHMYETVYYHKTVRAASFLLTAMIRRAATCLASAVPDDRDPFRAVLSLGKSVALSDYARATDAVVWYHIDRWRDSEDDALVHLAKSLCERRFPKTMDMPDGVADCVKLKEKAQELVRASFPKIEDKYLMAIDEPERVSYKRYSRGEGADASILTLERHAIKPRAIEDYQRSLVPKVAEKMYKSRLIVPNQSIRDQLLDFARRERIKGVTP
ncbi:MAG: hypothetical protein HC927_09260 [Deltaproteobacteria bacterium]|nr:hypothetical protein [Deltaproteobacteria bacterium]